MKSNRLYFTAFCSLLLSSCSSMTGREQAVAPVYDPYYKPADKPAKPSVPAKPAIKKQSQPPPQTVVTTPLEPVAPPKWATSIEHAQPEQLSPVVVALISDADQNSGSGNLDSAVASLERGLRIEPRNATLIYKLAEVRLKQSQPRLAEDLAKKSALLAGSDRMLKKRSWLLVAEALKMQGDSAGAREAEIKADGL